MLPRPCTAASAVARARELLSAPALGNATHSYQLGTGDFAPHDPDVPWTSSRGGPLGSDCAGLIVWAYELPRHRPGFNTGAWATVSDDLNSNSMIEDADHAQDLFRRVSLPQPGDVLAYPTIRLPGKQAPWIGHVALVVGTDRAGNWDPNAPQYHLLDIVQVCGPNGRTPAAIATDGAVFDRHSVIWPKPEHRTVMLRIVP